jgi:hypothetical protein
MTAYFMTVKLRVFKLTQGVAYSAAHVSSSSGILAVDGRKHNLPPMGQSPMML